MPDPTPPPGSPQASSFIPITGRTAYDALTELFQILGRATPYFVVVGVFVYAMIEVTKSYQQAHSDAARDYATRVDNLIKLQEHTYGELEKIRTSQIDTLEKFSKLNTSVIDAMANNQKALMGERDALFAEQKKLRAAEDARQIATRSADELRTQMDSLNRRVWAAENIIDIANRLVAFLNDENHLALDHRYLARRYENADSSQVARDSQGKLYYGVYRIPADQIGRFLNYLDRTFPQFAARLNDQGGAPAAISGSDQFVYEWQSVSRDSRFQAAQDDFIETGDYRILLERIRIKFKPPGESETLLDPDKHSEALRAVFWSVVVQHGPNIVMLARAFDRLDLRAASDEALIRAIYAERRQVNNYFPGESSSTKNLLAIRYRLEEQEAIKMLGKVGVEK
jgi:hypothetical protein